MRELVHTGTCSPTITPELEVLSAGWSRWRGVPLPPSDKWLRAAWVLPSNINFMKVLDNFCPLSRYGRWFQRRQSWIILSSLIQISIQPQKQCTFQTCLISFGLDVCLGFCRRSIGITIVAFVVTDSKEERVANASNNLANCDTNRFPTLPWGILKQFFC